LTAYGKENLQKTYDEDRRVKTTAAIASG
jgi:hypothetical protein